MKVLRFLILFLIVNQSSYSQNHQYYPDSLKQKITQAADDTNKVNLYFKLGNYYYTKVEGQEQNAYTYIDSGIILSKKIGFYPGFFRASFRLSNILRVNGDYKKSLDYLEEAEKTAIALNDSMNLLSVYIGRGATFISQGYFTLSAENYFKALAIADKLKDTWRLSRIYNGLGNLYYEQGDCRKGVFYHKNALKLRMEQNDTLSISHSYVNLGLTYFICNEYDTSNFYFTKALQIQKIKNNKVGQAYSYNGMANNYFMKKQTNQALTNFLRAKTLLLNADDVDEQFTCYLGLGKVYMNLNKPDSAFRYLTLGKDIVENINKISGKQVIYEQLSKYYEAIENYKDALYYHKLYLAFKDSVFSTESIKSISSHEYNRQKMLAEQVAQLEENQKQMLHDEELQKQKRIVTYFVVGFILLLLLSIYIYKNYKQKSKINEIIMSQKQEVELKNAMIEEKQKEIIDSILYAKRIQQSLMPTEKYIESVLKHKKD